MPAHILLAPAASGKTQYSIQLIRETLTAEPLASITGILPNQIRVSEFRRRLADAGGALGVHPPVPPRAGGRGDGARDAAPPRPTP